MVFNGRRVTFTADLLPHARRLLLEHQLPTLDAFHVAAALTTGRRAAAPEELLFASHDSRQRAAAAGAGLRLA